MARIYNFKIMIFKFLKQFGQIGKMFLARHLSKNMSAIARRNEREPQIAPGGRRQAQSGMEACRCGAGNEDLKRCETIFLLF